jgi:hypothetical protein
MGIFSSEQLDMENCLSSFEPTSAAKIRMQFPAKDLSSLSDSLKH